MAEIRNYIHGSFSVACNFSSILYHQWQFNTLRPRQNGWHFPDDILKCIFLNENVWILIEMSLKFVPKGPINNIPALVQIMAWHRLGDKPLSEPMMVRLLTQIYVTRPQWVNGSVWISNYTNNLYNCIITYPCHKLYVSLVYLCKWNRSLHVWYHLYDMSRLLSSLRRMLKFQQPSHFHFYLEIELVLLRKRI